MLKKTRGAAGVRSRGRAELSESKPRPFLKDVCASTLLASPTALRRGSEGPTKQLALALANGPIRGGRAVAAEGLRCKATSAHDGGPMAR